MGALADLLDRRFGGADETRNLRILEFGMIAHQPKDGVRPILALGHRCVTRAAALGFGNANLRIGDLDLVVRIGFALGDFGARQLAGGDGIETLDALRGLPVGNGLHFKRMKLAKLGNLFEGKRGVIDEPHGGRFRHQQLLGHG